MTEYPPPHRARSARPSRADLPSAGRGEQVQAADQLLQALAMEADRCEAEVHACRLALRRVSSSSVTPADVAILQAVLQRIDGAWAPVRTIRRTLDCLAGDAERTPPPPPPPG